MMPEPMEESCTRPTAAPPDEMLERRLDDVESENLKLRAALSAAKDAEPELERLRHERINVFGECLSEPLDPHRHRSPAAGAVPANRRMATRKDRTMTPTPSLPPRGEAIEMTLRLPSDAEPGMCPMLTNGDLCGQREPGISSSTG